MLLFSTKTQKERKGLGTSPFGALRLTTVPIPCVSVHLGKRRSRRLMQILGVLAHAD